MRNYPGLNFWWGIFWREGVGNCPAGACPDTSAGLPVSTCSGYGF